MKRESEQVDKPIAMMENQQNFMESLWQSLGGPGQSQPPAVQSQASPNMRGQQRGFHQQRGGGYQGRSANKYRNSNPSIWPIGTQ